MSLLVLLSSRFQAFAASARPVVDAIDGLIDEYVAGEYFAGSVLVAKDGEVLLARGYGMADPERDIPNTPDTRFMIGSITKQFTAMLAMQLVERGALQLDARISDFLPRFPRDFGDRITVEMLLLHTSGLRLPEGIESYYFATRQRDYLETFIDQLSTRGLRFEPGARYGYSNAGYHILGLIIEQVTGKSYAEVLAEQILEPLGMAHTGCNQAGLILESRAVSHHRTPGGLVTWSPEHSFDPGIIWFGSGFLYSTVRDLYRFSEALSSDALLSDESRSMYLGLRHPRTRHMFSHIPETLRNRLFGTHFGNGFVGETSIFEDPDTGKESALYWHDGTMYLFKSSHYRFADENLVIIVLSNCSVRFVADEIVLRIHELINGRSDEDVRIKRPLWQYVSEDIHTHAGFDAAMAEYHRLKADTLRYVVPHPSRVHREELRHALQRQGMTAMVRMARVLRAGDPCEIDEGTLNRIGYGLLQDERVADAVTVFELNVELYPDYANGFDSLAEAYMTRGDRALAIANYRKALEMDPQNENAVQMLARLKGGE